MSGFLAVTNWTRYQHYRDRTPVWVKFYVEVLHDEKLKKLPLSTRLLWDQMLLLAASFQNAVPNSPELIGNLTGIHPDDCREGIELLIKGRWLREKQTRRSASKNASLEKEEKRERKEARARERANLEAAGRYVRSEAHVKDDRALTSKLESDFGLDQMAIRRLLVVAAEERSAA